VADPRRARSHLTRARPLPVDSQPSAGVQPSGRWAMFQEARLYEISTATTHKGWRVSWPRGLRTWHRPRSRGRVGRPATWAEMAWAVAISRQVRSTGGGRPSSVSRPSVCCPRCRAGPDCPCRPVRRGPRDARSWCRFGGRRVVVVGLDPNITVGLIPTTPRHSEPGAGLPDDSARARTRCRPDGRRWCPTASTCPNRRTGEPGKLDAVEGLAVQAEDGKQRPLTAGTSTSRHRIIPSAARPDPRGGGRIWHRPGGHP